MHDEKLTTNKLLINCKEATLMVVLQECDHLPFKKRFALWIHLLICKYCKLFNKQSKQINDVLKKHASEKNLSLSFEKKQELTHLINELQRRHV